MDKLLISYENDENVTLTEKVQCLKTLRVIVKNLSDPDKVHDEKYRQFKCNNPKIQIMIHNPNIVTYLQSIGFSPDTNTNGDDLIWKIETIPDNAAMSRAYMQVCSTLERLEGSISVQPVASTSSLSQQSKKPRTLQHASSTMSTESISSISSSVDGKLTEKQKARILLEQKQAIEKEEIKLARQRTKQQIQNDKMVRENDPNWRPAVSAAAAKNGNPMLTFRDKFGE